MGLYDRDYYQGEEEPTGFRVAMPQTVVGRLILVNVVVAVLDLFSPVVRGDTHWIADTLALKPTGIEYPWNWWQLLTYGFTHASLDGPRWTHLVFNMLGFWFLGRDLEARLGAGEFLRYVLAAIVVGGIVSALSHRLGGVAGSHVVGASGALVALVILFATTWPHRELMLFFFPIPAWLFGVLMVSGDLSRAMRGGDSDVAFEVHLAGAAFALCYHYWGWKLSDWIPDLRDWRRKLRRRPKLKVHTPEANETFSDQEIDRLLDKINQSGMESLTRSERETLEKHSRRLREQRK